MDTRIEGDKVELHMDDDSLRKMPTQRCCRDWNYHIPTALGAIALILIVGTIIGASIQIAALHEELMLIKGDTEEKVVNPTQKLPQTGDSPYDTDPGMEFGPDAGRQISQLNLQMCSMRATIDAMQKTMSGSKGSQLSTGGSSYTRWGKKSCPSGSDLLYDGFVAGAATVSDRATGGGTNYLCMVPQPEWNRYDMRNDSLSLSWLYAAEYMSYNLGIYPNDVHSHNMACSVCRAPRSSQVMIPGRRTCPDSTWTQEYEGYLMSSFVNHKKSSYICVDAEPDVIGDTFESSGASFLSFVAGYCNTRGGLAHCPPYVHAREITCVVCSK